MAFVVIFLLGAWQGSTQGIIGTVATILFISFGVVIAIRATPYTASVIGNVVNKDNPAFGLLAFAINLVLLWLLLRIVKAGLDQILQTLHLTIINRLLGGLAGGGFALLLYSAVIWFMDGARLISNETKEQSTFYDFLADMPDHFKEYGGRVWPYVKESWQTSMGVIEGIDKGRQRGYRDASPDGEPRIEKLPNNYNKNIDDDPDRGRKDRSGIEY